jgi:serine/threonine protein kinase
MPAQECEFTAAGLRIGQMLGSYRVDGLLGAGGMGIVYRAWDPALERTVAIKVVDHARCNGDGARRLLQEARLAAALSHPSICAIYEVGDAGGRPFIVMEYLAGSPLACLIPADVGLPLELAQHYASQVVDAVAHAHRRGIVHRDLKSSNVIVAPDGRAKLLDFGLAVRHAVDASSGELETTCSGDTASTAGTVPYMAPERLRGREADARADIWALGVLIYEMVTGHRPFPGATRYEMAAAILGQAATPLPPTVPAALRQVVARTLAKDPADRYQHASELAAALDDLPQVAGPFEVANRRPAAVYEGASEGDASCQEGGDHE